MALFPVYDIDKKIYEEELRDFLPEKIIDIHTHVYRKDLRKGYVNAHPVVKRTVSWPSLVAAEDPIEDLQESFRLLFPGKECSALIFASTSRDSAEVCNAYIRDCHERTGFPALYYSRPEQNAEELEYLIRAGHFLGIKSYLSLSPEYIPEAEVRILDFFPHHQLELMNKLGAIVMLHIPRHGRLKDPVNLAQIVEIKKKYPNILLIIAHIGRAYVANDIGNAFEVLSQCPDLLFDFTANCCDAAMEAMLRSVGPNRVLFGSDLPILRMRTHRIEENNTYINLVPPGLYGDPKQDPHLREVSEEEAKNITFFMYEEILSFKRAAEKVGLTKADVERAFYGNAADLIAKAEKNIYGE